MNWFFTTNIIILHLRPLFEPWCSINSHFFHSLYTIRLPSSLLRGAVPLFMISSHSFQSKSHTLQESFWPFTCKFDDPNKSQGILTTFMINQSKFLTHFISLFIIILHILTPQTKIAKLGTTKKTITPHPTILKHQMTNFPKKGTHEQNLKTKEKEILQGLKSHQS